MDVLRLPRPVACRCQQRQKQITDRRRDAARSAATLYDAVAALPFERPACLPVCKDRCTEVSRGAPESIDNFSHYFIA